MTRNALITGPGRRRGTGAGMAADGWDLGLSFWRPYDKRHGTERQPDDPDRLLSRYQITNSTSHP